MPVTAQGPSFANGNVAPDAYVLEQNVSTPTIPAGIRIPAAIGQGTKTLLRTQSLTKGASNGQDAPLAQNVVIQVTNLIDANNVIYTEGVDFLLTRISQDEAVIDWSPKASIIGTVNLTTLTYPAQLDGTVLRMVVNGGDGNPTDQAVVLTAPANAAAVVAQINAWSASLAGVASLNASNQLVLKANSVVIETGNAASILGLQVGTSASVQEPATGLTYTVYYTSDKIPAEYNPQLFSNMNNLIAYHGGLNPPVSYGSGDVTGTGTYTLSDSTQAWTVNAFEGYYLTITGGTGEGQVRVIISNTATQLTVSETWTQYNTPDGTSTYLITNVNDNSISRGAQTMTDAGAAQIITSQYADDIFDTNDIKLAIDNLNSPVANGFFPECLVLMRGLANGSDDSLIDYLKANVDLQSGVAINHFRVVILGMAAGTDANYLTYINLANGIQDRRVTLINLASINKNFGFGLETVDGSYIAAGYAGVYCSSTVDAGEPITQKSLGAVFDVGSFTNPYEGPELDQMEGAGVTCIVGNLQGTDILIRHAVTTDPTNTFSWEAKLTRSADYVSNTLRAMLRSAFVGKRFVISPTSGSNDIQSLAKSLTVFLLTSLQNPRRQIIVGWGTDVNGTDGTISVSQNAQVAQELDLATNIALTTDVVWVLTVLGFTAG